MSTVHWQGDFLIQASGGSKAELGYIQLEEHSGRFVLWLRDHDAGDGSYVRGDEFDTRKEAKRKAARSSTASLMHVKWLRSLPTGYGFLALEFDSTEVEQLADRHIRPTIKAEVGYEIFDMRDVSRAGVIDQLLCETIRGSKFLIADLTDDNNGVYWEAGFAEGCDIPVIYICEESKFNAKSTHFDTSHRTTIMWSAGNYDQFAKILVATIRRTVHRGTN